LATSAFICASLADDPGQRLDRPLSVINPECFPFAVPEVKFRQIPIEMLRPAVLVNALHAAFENRKVAFDSLRVDSRIGRRDVLVRRVMHRAMIGKVPGQGTILRRFVCHHPRLTRDVRANNRDQGTRRYIVHHHALGKAGCPVNEAKNLVLVLRAAPLLLALRLDGFVVSDEGFVDFDDVTPAANRLDRAFVHRRADAMRHEPRSFQRHPKRAMKLVARNPFLARTHQIDGLEPDIERHMRLLKHGADLYLKLYPAVDALAYAETYPLRFVRLDPVNPID